MARMIDSPHDHARLLEALELAELAIGLTDPNPRVGCVIRAPDGTPAGSGHTQAAGGLHAEAMALQQAKQRGLAVTGGTAWVTLEPCAHHGRTPPCCDALIQAGLSRVVVAGIDPFPAVAGKGVARMRAAGIQVDVLLPDSPIALQARDLNIGFFSRVVRGRPWVRMKMAASLDGATALQNGQSQWITSPEARRDGHSWRRRAGAVITGIGTVLADDPRMDVREVPTVLQPRRVVLDSHLRTPPQARILLNPGHCYLVCSSAASADKAAALTRAGAVCVPLSPLSNRPDVQQVLHWLTHQSVNEVHVEAGATVNASFLQAGVVDELLVYLAPLLLGPGNRPMAALPPLVDLAHGLKFEISGLTQVGPDIRIQARSRATA